MKAKKAAKKSVQKTGFTHVNPLATSRAIIGFLIVLLASSVFILFYTYQDNIMQSNMFVPFMVLTVIGMGLLVSLLFLINPSKAKR